MPPTTGMRRSCIPIITRSSTNPTNWRQFFDFGDGGVARSNGVFVDDSGDCGPSVKNLTGANLIFCNLVLSRIPQRIDAINRGLRTLHFYEIEYSKFDPDKITGGTQDNGSWETLGDTETWLNTNIADGGHNAYDALGGNPNFRLTGWQAGSILASFTPQDQVDITWIADTINFLPPYVNEAVPFIGNAITDPVQPGWLWTAREHVFRSTNYGLNPELRQGRCARQVQRMVRRLRPRPGRHLRAAHRHLRRLEAARRSEPERQADRARTG